MREKEFDVVVAGGGCAGVAAAAGAAKTGAKVLLVERYGFLGGAATASQVLAFCGFYPQSLGERPDPVVAGIGREVLDQLALLGVDVQPYFSSSGNWPIRLNPEATKIAFDRVMSSHGVHLAYHSSIVATTNIAERLTSVTLQDPRGVHEISARAFVDASGDAELSFLAGAEACPLYNSEVKAQPASFPIRISGVKAGANIDRATRAAALANCERRLGRAELKADGGFLTALPGIGDFWWLAMEVQTNGLDGDDLAEAEQHGRELAWRAAPMLRLIPGWEEAVVSVTGPKIGIRETRHTASVEPLLEQMLSEGRRDNTSVALGAWPMEIHLGEGKTEYRPIGGDGVYGIPYGSLQSSSFKNLTLAGRCIGADSAAYGSARVMATAFATGHAAGVGAALGNSEVQLIKRELVRQNALIS